MIPTKIGVLLLAIIGLSFLTWNVNLYLNIIRSQSINYSQNLTPLKHDEIPEILKTCKLPDLDPWDPLVKPFLNEEFWDETLNKNSPKNCVSLIPPMTSLTDGKVALNSSYENGNRCDFRCLYPKNDYLLTYGPWLDINSAKPDCDIVEVVCFNENNTKIYTTLHTQVYNNQTYKNSTPKDKNFLNKASFKFPKMLKKPNDRPPDVHIILFDSVSYSAFIRTMERTRYVLNNDFGAIRFSRLNKNGMNSRPNAFAFLLGKLLYGVKKNILHPEIPSDCHEDCCKDPMDDDEQFIAFHFKKAGYKTLMSEDWADGVFNLNGMMCAAFTKPPVDHYMRPFHLRVEGEFFSEWKQKGKNGELYKNLYRESCREPHHYLIEYLKQFIDKYPDEPKFSLSWMVYLAHNEQNGMYHTDEYFYRFFRDYREKLQNSYIIVMGDHGPRYGKLRDTKVGMFEDNNPSLFFVVPEKIRANKEIMWTLQTNSKQLISHYDLYATLVDIVRRSDPSQANKKLILYGTSFLEPLPQPRNCVDLKIPIEYCQCEFNKVSKSNDIMLTRSLAKFMVFTINEKIRQHNYSHLCAFLKLDPRASVEVEEFEPGNGLNIYQVTVQVQPGGGRFWGYFHAKYDKYEKPSYELVSESMPRLNTYGGQECPDLHPLITPYCYCRDEKNHFVDPKLGHRIDIYTYVNITL